MTLELPLGYKRMKKTEVLDPRVFKVCEVKEKEIGYLRRKLLFIHFDGKTWNLLVANPDLSKVKYVQLE